MIRFSAVLPCVAGVLLGAVVIAGCGSPASTPSGTNDAGAQLVQTKCSMCHTLDRVTGATYDKEQWEQVVTRMQDNGLVVTEEEKQRIIDYLGAQ